MKYIFIGNRNCSGSTVSPCKNYWETLNSGSSNSVLFSFGQSHVSLSIVLTAFDPWNRKRKL